MDQAPPIGDYGLLSDCHSAALVSSSGSIDWCCLPRFDAGSTFGRLIDWERGGHCSITPTGELSARRRYLDETLVLETTFETDGGRARLTDCMLMPPQPRRDAHPQLLRVLECVEGEVELAIEFAPRFDYGEIEPWLRRHDDGMFSATGGDDGLLVWSDAPLEADRKRTRLDARTTTGAGERLRLLIAYRWPEDIDPGRHERPDPEQLDGELERTIEWWREWADDLALPDSADGGAARSAIVLKGLSYEPTGAIVAAPTTSLPEAPGGERNWDYRYAWIRDAVLSARSLANLCVRGEADAFRTFVERTSAGHAAHLRLVYGVGGERRLEEHEVGHASGYRGARPVRVGNAAVHQLQLDAGGQLLVQSWKWHVRGNDPDDDYWRFLCEVVDWTLDHWREPDAGIWEWRGEPKHFVHSKALCWAAVDRALALADDLGRDVPAERWQRARDEIRATIEDDGYDDGRRTFVQALGEPQLDAAVLRLPVYGLVDWDDERMVGTADAIARELREDGLVRRYDVPDGAAEHREGAFLACSFWLAEAYARQGRVDAAEEVFERAMGAANDLGLMAEEADPSSGAALGNFPQGLSHLSHIEAVVALADARTGAPARA